jgi:hypothetical protein
MDEHYRQCIEVPVLSWHTLTISSSSVLIKRVCKMELYRSGTVLGSQDKK